jgi:hypothetical protein
MRLNKFVSTAGEGADACGHADVFYVRSDANGYKYTSLRWRCPNIDDLFDANFLLGTTGEVYGVIII